MFECSPWDFYPSDDVLAAVRALKKPDRRQHFLNPGTVWQCYSVVRPRNPLARCTSENPAQAVLGFSADYDLRMSEHEILAVLGQIPEENVPQYLETTLGGKARLVWRFERPVLVHGQAAAKFFLAEFASHVGARTLLPGYDAASEKPEQLWTNGGRWFDLSPSPVPQERLLALAMLAAKKHNPCEIYRVPLEKVAEEVQKRWPGRWQGDFVLDAVGVRFYDDRADNPTGCQVKPDGVICFTGPTPFMSWRDILGADWVKSVQESSLAEAIRGFYFDGHWYWGEGPDGWVKYARADALLQLKLRGLNSTPPKGERVSDLERGLGLLQTSGRVAGAAAFVNRPPGIIEFQGRSYLNTSRVRPLQPAETGDPSQFPWLHNFLNGFFARPELRPLDYFLGWLRRSYIAIREYRALVGQAVFICGPRHNGKTLLAMRIVAPLLGQFTANPYDWMVGDSTFNSELFEAFLWTLNDEESPRNEMARQKFIARLKSTVVNPIQTYHPKFCDRISISYTNRFISTLNDDAQSAAQIPERNDATEDKLMFFASQPYAGEWPANNEVEDIIARELPHFACYLLNWQPPDDIVDPGLRTEIKSYFDPAILALSRHNVSSSNLLELLKTWQRVSWEDGKEDWTGTPTDLLMAIAAVDVLAAVARDWNLARLSRALVALARIDSRVAEIGDRVYRIERV